jgi:hypothetical protein
LLWFTPQEKTAEGTPIFKLDNEDVEREIEETDKKDSESPHNDDEIQNELKTNSDGKNIINLLAIYI